MLELVITHSTVFHCVLVQGGDIQGQLLNGGDGQWCVLHFVVEGVDVAVMIALFIFIKTKIGKRKVVAFWCVLGIVMGRHWFLFYADEYTDWPGIMRRIR